MIREANKKILRKKTEKKLICPWRGGGRQSAKEWKTKKIHFLEMLEGQSDSVDWTRHKHIEKLVHLPSVKKKSCPFVAEICFMHYDFKCMRAKNSSYYILVHSYRSAVAKRLPPNALGRRSVCNCSICFCFSASFVFFFFDNDCSSTDACHRHIDEQKDIETHDVLLND